MSVEISNCIYHHNGIIKFVSDLRNWINPVMFLEFLVCSVMLCAIGFQATMIDGITFKLFVYIEYLTASLIELFLFYWFANEVILESLKVSVSIWDCKWYTFDTKSRQLLVMIMMRSQRPLIFRAGPFNEMSLATYIGILKASYTYLTILRQLYG
ncbi:odorant receptor Or2-like [Chrysoperla carnea]|uniref:odorant receptor Or2-like n=1 Tax=Chrysoperla carnea TaxID=189513 RepID=UPI001D068468|nr:odorant receptor Or2-like [Chrysoperla carnea]